MTEKRILTASDFIYPVTPDRLNLSNRLYDEISKGFVSRSDLAKRLNVPRSTIFDAIDVMIRSKIVMKVLRADSKKVGRPVVYYRIYEKVDFPEERRITESRIKKSPTKAIDRVVKAEVGESVVSLLGDDEPSLTKIRESVSHAVPGFREV